MGLQQRWGEVQTRIERACQRAGRERNGVELLAVSKGQPVEKIAELCALGQRFFGENYVQELADKAAAMALVRWRFIGHLQRNKVKTLLPHVHAVDSVDSARLLDAIAGRAAEQARVIAIMLQVNLAGETQKSGCSPTELPSLIARCREHDHVDLQGLMTIPPASEHAETARPHFKRLRQLADEHGLRHCSMGMSADLDVAIEEGATMVRVGTALFGPR